MPAKPPNGCGRRALPLYLVTANYHMPRSLVVFRRAMPGMKIVAYPVFPPQFKSESWWRFPGTAELLATEFNKYLIARLALDDRMPTAREDGK